MHSDKRIMEVDKIREIAQKYILPKTNGLDLGFGGNKIIPGAIGVDQEEIYCKPGPCAQNLFGDARNLYWFKDNSLDYVFSSHLLEDYEETEDILKEWLRVLKVNGRLILYLPDEQKYKDWCENNSRYYNNHHKVPDMSLEYMKELFKKLPVRVIYTMEEHEDKYSFFIVLEKQ